MTDCATRLEQAKIALHNLLTGEQIKATSVNGRNNIYFDMDEAKLRRYIADLERECGNGSRRRSFGFHG